MENIEQILQKLVAVNLPPLESDKVQHLIQHAFEAGKAEKSDPLEGYSNLTEAIESGPPIDWEKLDRLKVQCVKSGVGAVVGITVRDVCFSTREAKGWWTTDMDDIYIEAFGSAWNGTGDWTLWIEGDIPLVRKTADQLEVGTYFLGQAWGDDPYLAYVGRPLKTNTVKTIYYAPEMLKATAPASEWMVLEEYGPFQKPEGK